MTLTHYLAAGLLAGLVSMLVTPWCIRLAIRLRIIDRPNERKMHRVVKPLLGGLAIWGTFTVLTLLVLLPPIAAVLVGEAVSPALRQQLLGLLLGGLLMFLTGLYDDIRGLSVRAKFACQIIAASILFVSGVKVVLFVNVPLISYLFTVLWVVAITNSFNLLDNMDGLSAGVAAIAAALFAMVFADQQQEFLGLIAMLLAGSAAGYLRYNFTPARVFMGDAGSLVLGFLMAALAVMGNYLSVSQLRHLPVIIPLLILAVPIFDTLSVMAMRAAAGISIFTADKRHFSHRLVNLGMTVKQAVLTIYLLTFAVGVTATLLPKLAARDALLVLLHTLMLFAVVVLLERASANRPDNGANAAPPHK
ncbi:MAG TPA: MraY family glycosyltransferase [bacterium]|nr:MraY family glycosyltransferase [bacterium]